MKLKPIRVKHILRAAHFCRIKTKTRFKKNKLFLLSKAFRPKVSKSALRFVTGLRRKQYRRFKLTKGKKNIYMLYKKNLLRCGPRASTSVRRLKRFWASFQLKRLRVFNHKLAHLSPKRYNFKIRIGFWHNNIRLKLDQPFLLKKYYFSSGEFSEFKKKKKLKRSYVAGLDLCLHMYRLMMGLPIRTFCVISSGGFGARKGFFAGLRKLRNLEQRNFLSKKPNLVYVLDKTLCMHNGTKRSKKRRL